MPQKIESAGTYIGTIAESGLTVTKKGFPQAVLRLTPTKKYIESPADIAHFQKQGLLQDGEPAYVDWSGFAEEIVAYLVMFNSADEFSKDTALFNYEQMQLATGWDGTEFDSFSNGEFTDREILFRVGEKKAYVNAEGKQFGGDGTLEVSWIDDKNASPVRSLKSIDATAVSALNAKLKFAKAPSKPASAPAPKTPAVVFAPKPTTPHSSHVTAAPSAASPSVTTAPAASAPSVPARRGRPPKKETVAPAAPAAAEPSATTTTAASAPPAETNQIDAWAFVNANKGGNEDQVVEEAWIDACSEVGSDKEEADFTGTDWARVRDIVLKDLAV